MRVKSSAIFAIFIAILALAGVSALSFDNSTTHIEESYAASSVLKGIINLSLQGESTETIIKTNFGDNISLKNFLEISNANYRCSPKFCSAEFESKNPSGTKTETLKFGETKFLGFAFDNIVTSVQNISFTLQSSSENSCQNPLEVNFLNDSSKEFIAIKGTDDFTCQSSRGCFNESSELNEVVLANKKYCEKVSLDYAPGVKLGGYIRGDDNITFYLLNTGLAEIARCNTTINGGYAEVSCTKNSSIEKGNYYACLSASGKSFIKYETLNENCGFFDTDSFDGSYAVDYFIFATSARYATIGQARVSSDFNSVIKTEVEDYLQEFFRKNCSNRCIIPVLFNSGVNQEMTISGLNVQYSTTIGPAVTSTWLQVEKTSAKIYMNYTSLDISKADFRVPANNGNYTLELSIGNLTLLRQKIFVTDAITISNITPLVAPAGIKTKFSIKTTGNKKIKKYTWNFGDSTLQISSDKAVVEHLYNKTGNFQISVAVEDINGITASKTAVMQAINPKELINITISDYKKRIDNVTKVLNVLPVFYSDNIKKELKSDTWGDELKEIEKKYLTSVTEEDYIKTMVSLSNFKIPKSISMQAGEIPAFAENSNINIKYISENGYDVENEEAYQEAIAAWFNDKNAKIKYTIVTANDIFVEAIGIFLKIFPAVEYDGETLLFVGNKNAVINGEHDIREVENGKIVKLGSFNDETEIFIPKEIDIKEVMIYASPSIDVLEISPDIVCNNNKLCEKKRGETNKNCRNDCKATGKALIYIFIVLILGFLSYIGLQWWYKYKYESYLFKNRDDLNNLISFTKNAFQQGMGEKEVVKLLRQNNWNGEQISYALKKTLGKWTGMVEIPFLSMLNFKKDEKQDYDKFKRAGFIR